VRCDWPDATDPIGYRNIKNKFVPGIIIDAAYETIKNIDKPYYYLLALYYYF